MKKLIGMLLVIAMLSCFMVTTAFADGSASIYATSASGHKDGTVSINVNAADFEAIKSGKITINFDPAVVEYISTTRGLFSNGSTNENNIATGKLIVNHASETPIESEGTLFTVNFKIVGNCNSSSAISVTVNSMYAPDNSAITAIASNGSVSSVHDWIAGEPVAATCTVDGYTPYTCSVCGEVENRDIVKGSHNMQKTADAVAPGCETSGKTEVLTCAYGCGYTEGGETIPATGHNMQETATAVAPGCETTGKTAVFTCANGCGHTEGGETIAALGHDWKDADCTNPKTCKVCGVTEGAALGHDMKEIEAAIPATCEGEGKTAVMECSRCGHKEGGAKINALGHDWKLTKSEAGKDCLTEGEDTYVCANDASHTKTEKNGKFGPHADEEFASNNNGTHDGYCPKCEQKLTDDEKCFDTDKDGKCDGCGYKFPETPTTKPDDGKDDVPKTGDITPYPVYFLVALMAVAAAAYGLKRKFDI